MILIHHLENSQSERIIWLCEELGLEYDIQYYAREPIGFAPASFRALHPFATAPLIQDGETVLGESGAIIEYLITTYGGGRLGPSIEDVRLADYLYWFHLANGSVTPAVTVDLVVGLLGGPAGNEIIERFSRRSDDLFALIEDRLGKVDYLAGNAFTAADIIMHYSLKMLLASPKRADVPSPNIQAYLERIGSRPAFKKTARLLLTPSTVQTERSQE